MPTIKIYDTKAGKKVDFQPLKAGEVSLYYCGPTVYNYIHLGNLRPVIVFDVLTRVFKALGYQTKVVSNYTDIDDKIISEALKEQQSEQKIAQFYIRAYEDSLASLHLLPLAAQPRASANIANIIDFIQVLLDKGFAYKAGDDVYFHTGKIADYGSLSHVVIAQNQPGKRIDVSTLKEEPADFALWKKTTDEGIKFDSPFGPGRPGWHTECVVMIKDTFKQPLIDIHGGGFDLKFPHHENERAQSLGYDQTPLANYWMHTGFLTAANGTKMSKSLGNVILAKDCLAQYSGNAIRLFFYQTHYRAPLSYAPEVLDKVVKDVQKYETTLAKLSYRAQWLEQTETPKGEQEVIAKALTYLADDLNVANALAVLEEEIKKALTILRDLKPDAANLLTVLATLRYLYELLGFYFAPVTLTAIDRTLLDNYESAHAQKDFATSDKIRATLLTKGIL